MALRRTINAQVSDQCVGAEFDEDTTSYHSQADQGSVMTRRRNKVRTPGFPGKKGEFAKLR
jgi:hypothetical protein